MRKTMWMVKAGLYAGVILLLSLSISACTKIGQQIPAAKMISFDDTLAEGEGRFDSEGLHVVYNYDRQGDSLRVWGRVAYNLPVESLDVYLLFTDDDGTVIDQEWVYSTGYTVSKLWGRSSAFERTLEVPDGAAAMSFDSSAVRSRGHQ